MSINSSRCDRSFDATMKQPCTKSGRSRKNQQPLKSLLILGQQSQKSHCQNHDRGSDHGTKSPVVQRSREACCLQSSLDSISSRVTATGWFDMVRFSTKEAEYLDANYRQKKSTLPGRMIN